VIDSETPQPEPALRPERVVCADSLGKSLLELAARAVQGRNGKDLDRVPLLGRRGAAPRELRVKALACDAGAEALGAESAGQVDADAVASWMTAQYPAARYPAVVLGSPHGAAVHLAAALGAPWLPTGFTVTVSWPEGDAGDWVGACRYGRVVADRILAANPGVTVRQIHDPLSRGPLCGSTLTLQVRWRTLPPAYQSFLRGRLEPAGASMLIRDTRTWPVVDCGPGHTFQIGSPANGWDIGDYSIHNPSFRRLLWSIGVNSWSTPPAGVPLHYAETAGEPEFEQSLRRTTAADGEASHRVLYQRPGVLSACVADIYREWLSREFNSGQHCVVETGGLMDPGQVLAAGLVPYWCESAARRTADAAEWWLAGSSPFESITVLPQPPGTDCDANAGAALWRSIARFARHRPLVDRVVMGRYPLLPLPTSRTASALASSSRSTVPPLKSPTMSVADAIAALRRTGAAAGMLVL
jgi:hypothetical protein